MLPQPPGYHLPPTCELSAGEESTTKLSPKSFCYKTTKCYFQGPRGRSEKHITAAAFP